MPASCKTPLLEINLHTFSRESTCKEKNNPPNSGKIQKTLKNAVPNKGNEQRKLTKENLDHDQVSNQSVNLFGLAHWPHPRGGALPRNPLLRFGGIGRGTTGAGGPGGNGPGIGIGGCDDGGGGGGVLPMNPLVRLGGMPLGRGRNGAGGGNGIGMGGGGGGGG